MATSKKAPVNTGADLMLSNDDSLPTKKKRGKKALIDDLLEAVKPPPDPSLPNVVLLHLNDGRILAIADKSYGNEEIPREIIKRNIEATYTLAYEITTADELIPYLGGCYVFYISFILKKIN